MRQRIVILSIFGFFFICNVAVAEDEAAPADITVSETLQPEASTSENPESVLGGEKLHHHLESSIGDTVDILPGVTSSGFSPGAGRPIIRGQRGPRVAVLENGLHIGDVSDVGDDHGVSYDPRLASRIEILRGSQTLAYGSTAIGGVANIIDESIAEKKLGRKILGEIDLALGDSTKDEKSGSFEAKGDADLVQWFLAGYTDKTDDYKAPKVGTVENSDAENKGGKIGLSHIWDKGFIGASLKVHESDYGVIGHEHEHEDEHEHHEEDEEHAPRIDLDQIRLDLRGSYKADEELVKAVNYGVSFSDYEHKELEGETVATKFIKDSREGTIDLQHELTESIKGGVGLHLLSEDFEATGEEAFLPSSERFSPALFLVEDFKLSEFWSVNTGGRYEFTSIDPESDEATKRFKSPSGSLGVSLDPFGDEEYAISLTSSYSERAPQSTELFANGAHIASQTFEIGDPALSNEEAVSVELIGRKNTGTVAGSAGVFYEFFPNYLGLFGTGEVSEGFPVFEYRESEAEFWGIEGDLDLKVLEEGEHDLSLLAGFDLVRAEDHLSDEWLPRTPPVRTRAGFEYRYDAFRFALLSTFAEAQKKLAPFETRTDGYTKLDADASVKIPTESNLDLEFYLRGSNLLDEEIRNHASFTKDIAPGPGASFLTGLRGTF